MNTLVSRIQKIIWALVLISSLGASVYLGLTFLQYAPQPPTDLSDRPGWETHHLEYSGKTFYYNEEVGLVMPIEDTRQNFLRNWSDNSKIWGVIQLAAVGIGLTLVFIKRPAAIKPIHRLNIAFGYLAMTWLNALLIAFRMRDTGAEIPPGYIFIAPPSGQMTSTKPDALVLIVIGLGISLVLGYAWIRWARADSAEEVFV